MKKILIIDDEQDIRDTLSDIFELSGYVALSARNGIEGFSFIAKFQPELIICDVNMPNMDGFELLEIINKNIKKEDRPKIIFLTARVEEADIKRGYDLGASDYLLKPFDHVEVLEIVKKHIL